MSVAPRIVNDVSYVTLVNFCPPCKSHPAFSGRGDLSMAREQKCIFCESWTTVPLGHVIPESGHEGFFREKRCH